MADYQTVVARLVREGSDLSFRQVFVLDEIFDKGEQTVKALHESGGDNFNKPGVTRAIDRLAELGFVVRKDDPKDRRSVLVSLTKSGKKFVETIRKI